MESPPTSSTTEPATRRVAFVVYPGIQPLDLAGPHEVFATANRVLDHRDGRPGAGPAARYRLDVCAQTPGVVAAESGLAIVAHHGFDQSRRLPIDTLIVVGGDGAKDQLADGPTVDFVRTVGPRCRRVASVCTGAFILAAAGLCDHRNITTHWRSAGELAATYPLVHVDPDPIYIEQDGLWTSAGVTAGIDLALALVENDCGGEVAQMVARLLVVPLRRSGKQTQYAAPVWADPLDRGPIQEAHNAIHADPASVGTVGALAARVGMSERNFARRFRNEVGESPARYIERVRIEHARRLLEASVLSLDSVATRSGFGTAETMRRAFHRRVGLSPESYRRQHAVV